MRKIILFLLISACLAGCIRKMDIQQGNIITVNDLQQLHLGMTAFEVERIMGTPILLNTFDLNRVDYVYTLKPGKGTMTEKYITLTFIHGHLSRINQNLK